MQFTQTIVKKPGKSYLQGLTTSDLGKPNYDLLLAQHDAYVEALEKCHVNVHILPADESFPDSTFVEDTAVLTKEFAIITNPGAASRAGEIIAMEPVIKQYFDTIEYIQSPGTLDGGDVLQIDNHFYIGLSSRTNEDGAKQFGHMVNRYGYQLTVITLEELFHLKTGISYIGNQTVVVTGELIDHPAFAKYKKIIVPETENYAANCLKVNDHIVIPRGYPQVNDALVEAGYQTISLDTSEFKKHDGGLSCLSLRF